MLSDLLNRKSGGLGRTIIVAVATLAILLVCFSMYQQIQLNETPVMTPRGPRLPVPGSDAPLHTSVPPSGVVVDGAVIGASRDVTISLYDREGKDSRIELTVTDWSPKAGSDHEFELRDPEIRMRAVQGNDLRVKAREGALEARRRGGSGLEPVRGRLVGDVVVEFDRRTQEEKQELSGDERSMPSEDDLVRLEAAVIEFDVEFGRLVIPGEVRVSARDGRLEARDVEVQFNRMDDRIESMRIERGGRIELVAQPALTGSVANGEDSARRQTLSVWLRQTLQRRMDAQLADQVAPEPTPAQAAANSPSPDEPDVPVFGRETRSRPRTALQYLGRFEDNVKASQEVNGARQSQLEADWLEIVRDLSLDDDNKKKTTASKPMAPAEGIAPKESVVPEQIILSWTGKLLVSQVSGDETRESGSRISAGGTPVRIARNDGNAVCTRFVYLPDSGDLTLEGGASQQVIARSAGQGTFVGEKLGLRRNQERIEIVATGAGRIWEDQAEAASIPMEDAPTGLGPANVEFSQGLLATGSVQEKTTINLSGLVTTEQYNILDRVTFAGRTSIQQGDTSLAADSIEIALKAVRTWTTIEQSIDRVVGRRGVVMTHRDDPIICDRIEVEFARANGKPYPRSATAEGSVSGTQGDRSLAARDKVIIDFDPPSTDAELTDFNASAAARTTSKRGESFKAGGATPARLRAFGDVSIIDASQSLDLSCEQVDATILDGADIDKALLQGTPDAPATVRVDTFTVSGETIDANVAHDRADVPGRGRITMLSRKDLDGRKVDPPIPIVVTWTENLKYRGDENRAFFTGNVHATSQTTTTFDCQSLLIEFEEQQNVASTSSESSGSNVQQAIGLISKHRSMLEAFGLPGAFLLAVPTTPPRAGGEIRQFSKEPRYIEAIGDAVAQTAELHEGGGMKSRARISGPKLSVHLQSELSKLLIEGAGDLLLEDFKSTEADLSAQKRPRADLFSDQSDAGPSKTLIEWQDRMWYDFGIDQTRFEGGVRLKHLSGAELEKVFSVSNGGTGRKADGRRTFLDADALMVDFAESPHSARGPKEQRMGRINSDRLYRFRASGRVGLRDEVDQFSLTAADLVYERPRKILIIEGGPTRKAQLIRQRPGKLPDQMAAQRIFFNLETGEIDLKVPRVSTSQ